MEASTISCSCRDTKSNGQASGLVYLQYLKMNHSRSTLERAPQNMPQPFKSRGYQYKQMQLLGTTERETTNATQDQSPQIQAMHPDLGTNTTKARRSGRRARRKEQLLWKPLPPLRDIDSEIDCIDRTALVSGAALYHLLFMSRSHERLPC